ncbi:ABC transporter ATP-binding protein [Ketobacter sp.]
MAETLAAAYTPSRHPTSPLAADDAIVKLEKISKHYDSVYACDDINLSIQRGEFFSLLGPSGCGKTTLLRILAGFEVPDEGRVLIDGVNVTSMPAYLRPVNMMFQSYALFPHMDVQKNIAFGLKQESMTKAQRKDRVHEMLAMVQLEKLAGRKPHQLSGGQRQRVALARALAKQPKLLLLDEPLGALDKKLREKTQFELVNLQDRLGITFVIVTHDQEEAMTMSSRIALMHNGRIEQLDAPRRMYEFPSTRYVADFIGLVNLFDGHVISHENDTALIECEQAGTQLQIHHSQPLAADMPVTVALRPEKIRLLDQYSGLPNQARAVIKDIAYLGDVSIYYAELETGKRVKFTLPNVLALAEQPLTWEQTVVLGWNADSCNVLTQ